MNICRIKGKGAFLLLALLVSALLASLGLSSVFANPLTTFSTTIKYYDNVAISYKYVYPSGGVWTSAGDVPIGGARNGNGEYLSQVYCIDPFVPFHSEADSTTWEGPVVTDNEGNTWGVTTTDRKAGYVTVAPWQMSGEMQRNADAVGWLLLNGYRGDFRIGDAESQASVARLKTLYPDLAPGINKTIALMATKVAIWRVILDDGDGDPATTPLSITRTTLDGTPSRAVFDQLVEYLVADALRGANLSGSGELSSYSTLQLQLIDDTDLLVPLASDASFTYYGPLRVQANTNSAAALEGVFLTASGFESGGIIFVDDSFTPLSTGLIFGTNQTASQLSGGSFSGGSWTSEEFYMAIPLGRGHNTYEQLTIKAMAKAPTVSVSAGTPVFLVYDDGLGIQNWNEVQAFGGAAEAGMLVDLYAEDSINTQDSELGSLYIQKLVENDSPLDEGREFIFQVYYQHVTGGAIVDIASATLLDLGEHPVNAAVRTNPTDTSIPLNSFTLKNGGLALIDGLPIDEYYYWVVELDPDPLSPGSGYISREYAIPLAEVPVGRTPVDEDANENGWSSPFMLDADAEMGLVTFFNTREVKARIQVGKVAVAYDGESYTPTYVMDVEFTFLLEYSDDGVAWDAYPLDDSNFISKGGLGGRGGYLVAGETGMFVLTSFEQAFMEVQPGFMYRVLELDPGQGWITAYVLLPTEGGVSLPPVTDVFAEEGDRTTEGIDVNQDGDYQFMFTNVTMGLLDLELTKTVAGNAATADDFNRLYSFAVFHKFLADLNDPSSVALEPIPLSTDGSWRLIDNSSDGYLTWRVEIKDSSGALLDPATVATRIKWVDVDTSQFNQSWGILSMPVVLQLKHGETATVCGLFNGEYVVQELLSAQDAARFTTTHQSVKGGTTTAGSGVQAELVLDESAAVGFINTTSTGPGGEDPGGDEPDIPKAGDCKTLLAGGFALLGLLAGTALLVTRSLRLKLSKA